MLNLTGQGYFLIVPLIMDYPDPGADAGQGPHVERYVGGVKSFQNSDVQPCCRPTTAERNCSLHHRFLHLISYVILILDMLRSSFEFREE